MEYEVFEPVEDEYYDQACAAAYAAMFNRRSDYSADFPKRAVPAVGNLCDN